MKKLKIVLILSAVMALSVVGFVKTQNINSETFQTIAQLATFNKAYATESSDDFTKKTCCEAVWNNETCSGCDGNNHSYARRI